MRKVAYLVSIFYLNRVLLASQGMALFCYLAPRAFGGRSKDSDVNQQLFRLTAKLIPLAGLGLLMIWLGMHFQILMRTWFVARTTVK